MSVPAGNVPKHTAHTSRFLREGFTAAGAAKATPLAAAKAAWLAAAAVVAPDAAPALFGAARTAPGGCDGPSSPPKGCSPSAAAMPGGIRDASGPGRDEAVGTAVAGGGGAAAAAGRAAEGVHASDGGPAPSAAGLTAEPVAPPPGCGLPGSPCLSLTLPAAASRLLCCCRLVVLLLLLLPGSSATGCEPRSAPCSGAL
jgi:hypothetical protein